MRRRGRPGSGADLGGGASVVPANTVAFVALDTDVSSGQWQAVDQLLQKFPAHDQLLTQLQKSFEQKTSLSWNDDVKPALGNELDVAVLPGAKPQLVVLTQPADAAKFSALLAKLKGGSSRQIGGWTVASDSSTRRSTPSRTRPPRSRPTTRSRTRTHTWPATRSRAPTPTAPRRSSCSARCRGRAR